MSVIKEIKDSYKRTKVKVKHPSLLAAKGLESLIDFVTPIASILTIGADPKSNIPEKILYGPFQVGDEIYKAISSYAANTGIRDFVNGAMGDLIHLIGNTYKNVSEKPVETLATVLAAYTLGKATKYAVKVIRKSKEDKYIKREAKK